MQPTDIDPALALMAEFGQVAKGTTRHNNQMRQDVIFADGTVPARYNDALGRLGPLRTVFQILRRPLGSARPRPNFANSSLSPPQWAGASARCTP